ncbi:hypothetical protein HYFRA_00005936 [Hymenoscyphus fraxineus]|uniref:Uncharacterized protein n=1 Tax=Hymenoscyphus fraxineus TaxID=746836 RepID=A0A9N9KXB4_9HELO|nr:hypothetical protein HYFRA_00005936 [Hymenoscyphus fraxineus]
MALKREATCQWRSSKRAAEKRTEYLAYSEVVRRRREKDNGREDLRDIKTQRPSKTDNRRLKIGNRRPQRDRLSLARAKMRVS